MTILVIDAQGGGIGARLVAAVRQNMPEARVIAVGTNSSATTAMLKAGADEAATGENSVKVCCRKADEGATGENPAVVGCRQADLIIGPMGIVIADSLLGEITAEMAAAVARSSAKRILIPFNHCDNVIVGVANFNTGALIQGAVEEIKKL